jgi:hypothetical protein
MAKKKEIISEFKTITWAKNCKHAEHQVRDGIYYCPWINDNKTQFGCSNKVDCPHINKPKQVKR